MISGWHPTVGAAWPAFVTSFIHWSRRLFEADGFVTMFIIGATLAAGAVRPHPSDFCHEQFEVINIVTNENEVDFEKNKGCHNSVDAFEPASDFRHLMQDAPVEY